MLQHFFLQKNKAQLFLLGFNQIPCKYTRILHWKIGGFVIWFIILIVRKFRKMLSFLTRFALECRSSFNLNTFRFFSRFFPKTLTWVISSRYQPKVSYFCRNMRLRIITFRPCSGIVMNQKARKCLDMFRYSNSYLLAPRASIFRENVNC